MAGRLIYVTKAGRAALVAAGNTGTAARKVVTIGVASASFNAADESLVVLPNERKRIATIAGENVAPDTIHVTLKDDSNDQYSLYGFGLYFDNGVLFAVYSQNAPIMEKSPEALLLLAGDMQFASIDTAALSFGEATFSNPPATTERQGVVELATSAEAIAGIDTQRAVTPAGLQATLGPALATKSNVGHHHATDEVDGLQSALAMKSNVGHRHAIVEVDGLQSTLDAKVSVSGGTMSGPLKATYLESTGGSVRASGYGGNTNAGILFLNAAGTRYVNWDGTNYAMPGAELLINSSQAWHAGNLTNPVKSSSGNKVTFDWGSHTAGQLGVTVDTTYIGYVWHSGNFTPASYLPLSGGNVNGQLAIVNSNSLRLQASNGYAAYLRADQTGLVGFINQAQNQWNVQITDGGTGLFRGQVWAAMGGGRLCEDGNLYGGVWGDYLSNWLNNQFSARDSNINGRAPKRNGNPNYGYVGCDTGNSLIINWDGNFRIFVDGQYGSALWGTHNFDPNSKAGAGAQVQWASGISELGGVVTGADITCDAGAPWVVEGLRTSGGGNRIYMRVVWLRNQ
jgi:hypothetical protein